MTKQGPIVIPGGSGYLGTILARWFHAKGIPVVILSRRKFSSPHARVAEWDGETAGPWVKELEGARAVINLAGLSVNCRYTPRKKVALINSRLLSTRAIGNAISACANKPAVWINSGTATIYEHTYGDAHTELNGRICANAEAKDEFSIEIARKWEEEFAKAECPGVRKIILRTSIVLGNGEAFSILSRLVRFGLGGRMGHGKQFFSWIHEEDFCRAIEFMLENENMSGIYNVAAPAPLTNSEMMRKMREAHGVPFGLPATKLMLEIGAFFLRTETELVIKSRKVFPQRLIDDGFKFEFADFGAAAADLVKRRQSSPSL